MAPCQRCGVGNRSGRGPGWCSDPRCRQAEKEERQAEESAKRKARQQERVAKGGGSRGPLPPQGVSRQAQRLQLQAERAEHGFASRGPKPEADNREAQRLQLQAERAECGFASRGPKPEADNREAQRLQLQAERAECGFASRGPKPEEDNREAQRLQLQAERAEHGFASRGPKPEADNREAQRLQLQAERAEHGFASRGPKPEEDNREAQRLQLQAERAEHGFASRGPKPEEDNRQAQRLQLQAERAESGVGSRGPKPTATEIQKQGYPFPDEDELTPEQVDAHYLAFVRSWGRFGLSRVCEKCRTLTPAKHVCPAKGTKQMLCKRCREDSTKIILPDVPTAPEALQILRPIEQHLIAMARISQVLIDKLPSGGPSAQWGRMYAVLMEDPFICDVLEGAILEEDGTVLVQGVQGLTASPARLDCLHEALKELKAQHCLYKANPAVDRAIAKMATILDVQPHALDERLSQQIASQGRQTGESGGSHSSALGSQSHGVLQEKEEDLEMMYLLPKELKIPGAETRQLQKARGCAALTDDMDVKLFPHLFPTGTGGWQSMYPSFSQYARKRLLSQDPRFEASPAYTMWLLEMQTKKRLSGNINVRISGQQAPSRKTMYERGNNQVYTALRDIPGTQPYIYAKKGVALSMYEQLGTPNFFMTLTCHARQPDILVAAITARLLRLRPEMPPQELERQAAGILRCYQSDEQFKWDDLSPNQLCNQQPAIVARQFMHQLNQLMAWLEAEHDTESHLEQEADEQDEPEGGNRKEPEDFAQAPARDSAGRHRSVRKERPPFKIRDYIIRIEWQKRGYPHAHILLWAAEWPRRTSTVSSRDAEKTPETEATVPDWSDEEAMESFTPTCAEDWSDKYICTKSPESWRKSTKVSPRNKALNAQLAELVRHKHSEYCGIKTYGSCRFGFPHNEFEERTRRRTSQEKYANSRWKSSLVVRRAQGDNMFGQYNIKILRRWRASMDLQVICELTSASRYILGYSFKSEEDLAARRRMESILTSLAASRNDHGGTSLSSQQVYKAAHAALQGRTTSTFEACHLLLGFPIVEFSREHVWVQVGPADTWTLSVPQHEESLALQQPESYRNSKLDRDGHMPAAQRWYREMQVAFGNIEVELPVEGGKPATCRLMNMNFLDFCAAFKFIGVEFPQLRKRPAIVGYRNFSPDQEPESFWFSRLLLYSVWTEPGDWLQEEDKGSHAAAFQRIARDLDGYPDFLRSKCFPQMDGTVNAARKLQAVQAVMYMKARMHPAHLRDGWANSKIAQDNYEDSIQILEALKARHGDDIEFAAPDHVPTGAPGDAFAPVEGGEESFNMLTAAENPSPETQHQRRAMEYIFETVWARRNTNDTNNTDRLHMLLHGPGGCGKSVVVRAAAHMLREAGVGTIIAAPTGVAAWNINGVTLHTCCLLPVVNQSYGRACDVPLPNGPILATLRSIWKLVAALFVDEMGFISSFMLERLDQHLRLAKNMPHVPFGGVHVVFSGDLYQLPPPGGLPAFASSLWTLLQLCELEGNQRAAKDPKWAAFLARVRVGTWTEEDIQELQGMVLNKNDSRQPSPKAVCLYPTRKAVAEKNRRYIEEHVKRTGVKLYQSPALDTNVKTGAPLSPEVVWADPENTAGLETLLHLAVGVRVMLRYNLDTQDGLVNGACGFVEHIDADETTGEIEKVWIEFEKKAGAKWCAENETSFVAISRRSAAYLDMEGSKASRLQFPLVLAKATTIHKSQAATLQDGAHSRLDATCKQEGQAYVALSRCPEQALCTLEFFNPKSLRFNSKAEWALTQLKAQQAERDGSQLWKQLFQPPQSKDFYEAKLSEMGAPDWAQLMKRKEEEEHADGELPWCCQQCGQELPNTKLAIKEHKQKCPSKPKAKAKGSAKAKSKGKGGREGRTKSAAKAKSRSSAKSRILLLGVPDKRPAADSAPNAPSAKLARTSNKPAAPLPSPQSNLPYFERQDRALCGMHALNNALGGAVFTETDMKEAVQILLEEGGEERGEVAQDHMAADGYYSSEVLAQVIQSKALAAFNRIRWEMVLQPVTTKHELEAAVGLVQNRDNAHWVAYRFFNNSIFRIDSTTRSPEQLTDQAFLHDLARYPNTFAIREV